jgi:hypothetical protein
MAAALTLNKAHRPFGGADTESRNAGSGRAGLISPNAFLVIDVPTGGFRPTAQAVIEGETLSKEASPFALN